MRIRRVLASVSAASLFALTGIAWSQVDIEGLDQPDQKTNSPPQDAGLEDGGGGLVIERGAGWGALHESVPANDVRPLAFEAARELIVACLNRTAEPREADLFVRYELEATKTRIEGRLVELESNPEIHIDEFTLRAATPIPSGGALWVESRAETFRNCLGNIAFAKPDGIPTTTFYCMSGRARFGAAELLIESRTWHEARCPTDSKKTPK